MVTLNFFFQKKNENKKNERILALCAVTSDPAKEKAGHIISWQDHNKTHD